MKVQLLKTLSSKIVVSHKPKLYQLFRSWYPYAIQVKTTTRIFQGVPLLIFFNQSVLPTEVINKTFERD